MKNSDKVFKELFNQTDSITICDVNGKILFSSIEFSRCIAIFYVRSLSYPVHSEDRTRTNEWLRH